VPHLTYCEVGSLAMKTKRSIGTRELDSIDSSLLLLRDGLPCETEPVALFGLKRNFQGISICRTGGMCMHDFPNIVLTLQHPGQTIYQRT
jgi:hypothetical protein